MASGRLLKIEKPSGGFTSVKKTLCTILTILLSGFVASILLEKAVYYEPAVSSSSAVYVRSEQFQFIKV